MGEHVWLTKEEVAELKVASERLGMSWILRLIADRREAREIVRCLVDPGASQDEAIWALDEARAMLEATK